jgi:hypothetical protein
MEWREKLHLETRLSIRISHVTIEHHYYIPYSANLASAEAPADRALLWGSDILSSSMMDGMAGEIASRNPAAYSNQPCLNQVSLERTMFSQFGQRGSADGWGRAPHICHFEQLNDG